MTSLAGFIKQCLSEDKYSSTFVNELDQRLETLNYTQLSALHKTFVATAAEAKVKIWKDANSQLVGPVEKWLAIRKEEHDREKAREAEIRDRYRKRQQMKEIRINEERDVIRQLQQLAKKNAEKEIRDLETTRKAAKKLELLKLLPLAEEKRIKYVKYAIAFLILGIVAVAIGAPSIIYIGGGIFVVIIITCIILYHAYKIGQIYPMDDNEEEILAAISIREEELYLKSLNALKSKEEEFQRKIQLDKEERRKIRLEKLNQEMINKKNSFTE
jgi:membrane-associated HD superfamily phosphohydrolase